MTLNDTPFSTNHLEAKLFLECIHEEDWQNPAIVIWIENMLMDFPLSETSDAAATISERLAHKCGPQNTRMLTLCSILLRCRGRISEAIHLLDLALYFTNEPEVTRLLKMYCSQLAGPPRRDDRMLPGNFLGIEPFNTARGLRKAWRALLDLEHESSSATSNNRTPMTALGHLSDSGSGTQELDETLEDWARRLPTRSASQEVVELQNEYKAASEALQASIWYLDP